MRYISEHQRKIQEANIPPEEANQVLDGFAANAVSFICEDEAKKLPRNLQLMKEYLEESALAMNLSLEHAQALYQESVKKIEKHFAYNDDFVVEDE